MNATLLILGLLGSLVLSAIAIGTALFFFLSYRNPEPSLLEERLTRLKADQVNTQSYEDAEKLKRLSRLYKDADYQNEKLGLKLERLPFFLKLKLRLQQAGIKTPADRYLLMNMLVPALVLLLVGFISGFPILALLSPLAITISYVSILFRRSKRYGRFISLLPDALGMMTTALRAGHSFQSSMSVVATEMSDPISTEFSALVRDMNLGIPVKEALARLVSKLDTLTDVRMFATAVTIQRESGGNLAEVLDGLGYTIRERFKLKGQIAALTGQSRLTGYVLGAAPIAILAGLSIFMPDYVKPLYKTDLGHLALVLVLVLQCIGFVIMRKIIEIRV